MNSQYFAIRESDLSRTVEGPAVIAHDVLGTGPEHVLVLHSWMGNARSFDPIKPFLDADEFSYAFADLRGYGRSRALRGDYTACEVAELRMP